ncbi:MAG: hypothetical protein CR967_06090, partial [Proteobacteria bacterium]
KIIKLSLAGLLFASFASAYDVAGKLDITFTGYKMAKKVGVDGTFKKVDFKFLQNEDFGEFLKSMKVDIDALSLDTKLKMRNDNIAIIFKNANFSNILAQITDVKGDDKAGNMEVEITMNKISKKVPFTYKVDGTNIVASGSVDLLDFALSKSFGDFAKKCKGFHAGKTWSDVGLKFSVPFKK